MLTSIGRRNVVKSIPTELGLLTSLSTLDFSHNGGLKGTIPDQLYNLTNMRQLAVYGSGLSGTISPSIANWIKLEVRTLFVVPLGSGHREDALLL